MLKRMTMNMDGEICHLFHPNVAGSHHVHGCPRHRPQAAAHGHQGDAVVARRRRRDDDTILLPTLDSMSFCGSRS